MKSLLLIVVLMAAGCAGTVPEVTQYLLRTDTPNKLNTDGESTVGIGQLTVASYIDRLGLVMETEEGGIRAARYYQWAEPLRESLRAFLANEVAARANTPVRARTFGETDRKRELAQLIDLRIDQLHGTNRGSAILVAYWAIVDPGNRKILSEHEFSDSELLSIDGYDGLVAAETRLLRRLAVAIAESL